MAVPITQSIVNIQNKNNDNNVKLPELSVNDDNLSIFSPVMIKGKVRHALSNFFMGFYSVENSKGINDNTTKDKEDLFLAHNAQRVAEKMKTLGNCYTGVKHALLTSGVIKDYADMPKGNASSAIEYFDKNPNKFEKISKKGEEYTSEQLKKLPAGHIIVYSQEGHAGHIAITNGNKQGMSDSFDNMKWLEEHGAGASCEVYRLTDGWQYNKDTSKLEFKNKK